MTTTSMRRCLAAAGIALTLVSAGARQAQAQYFGQNHVQYQTFRFQILRTEHFDVYFYDEERDAAHQAAQIAERWYVRLSEIFQDSLAGRQPLILYAAASQFRQTNTVSGLGEGTGGVTEAFKRRIVLPFGVSLDESDHVIGHELVHAFQYDIAGRTPTGVQGSLALPLWFIEGMAEYLSLGPVDPNTSMWMRDAMQRNRLPRIRDLDDPRFFPYRYGQALWAYISGRFGDEAVGQMMRAGVRMREPMEAFRAVLRVEPESLSADWHRTIREAYGAPPPDSLLRVLATTTPGETPPVALFTRRSGGSLNLGPALSPDGQRIVFLSERSHYAVDAYLADASSGRVIKKLTESAVDPHLESLQFIYSAGAWNPDNRHFAVAAQGNGRPVIRIIDVDGGGSREIELRELDEIFNPSWSPDGRQIVFTAQVGGLTDLYAYDTGSSELRRLTNDAYANLHPAWSPDGNTIAYVTDRGTDLARLAYGRYRIVLLNVATGQITELPAFPEGKQINPQWSVDGRSLFFIADPDGISNVYRYEVANGRIYRLTDLYTGASGITALSPAISVGGDRMAVSVYRDGGAEIHRIDGPALAGELVTQPGSYQRMAMLPPAERATSIVQRYLADASTGLPKRETFMVLPYRPSFGLDYVTQTNVGVSTSRFGTFVGGGVQFYWSSMLGERQLATMVMANGTLKDIGAGVGYTNLNRRIDWMVQASWIPYVYGGYGQGVDTAGGTPVFVEQQVVNRQINRQLGIAAQFPFNRSVRLEAQASARYITFNTEVRQVLYDINSGAPIGTRNFDQPAGDPLTLGELMGAYVYDNTLFGGTAPMAGQRFRLEASPTFGSLNFIGALADLRKYFLMTRNVTFAVRAMHYGRYGKDENDGRISPLFVGYQSLVRGYDNGSFNPSECNPSGTSSCPVYDQLLGTKVLVGNAELRVQLLGPLGVAVRGFLPVDFIAFADGGVAWYGGQEPFSPARPGVSSVGAGLRLNLFGFIIGELDVVRPLNRPDKGTYLQFGFNPGF